MTVFQTIMNWCRRQNWEQELELVSQRLQEAEALISTLTETIRAIDELANQNRALIDQGDEKIGHVVHEVRTLKVPSVHDSDTLDAVEKTLKAHQIQLETARTLLESHETRLNDTDKKIHVIKQALQAPQKPETDETASA